MNMHSQYERSETRFLWVPEVVWTLCIALMVLWPVSPCDATELSVEELYAKTSPGVVFVFGTDGKRGGKGTGSIIRKDGLIITNAHVVIDKQNGEPWKALVVAVKPDKLTGDTIKDLKRAFQVKVLALNGDLDLALLQMVQPPADLPVIKFGDSEKVNIGAQVIAIGHPEKGGVWSLTTGAISAVRANLGNVQGKHVFQTEASLNRGNSGGPLINHAGHQIGVNVSVARVSEDGFPITDINFAIKSAVAKKWMAAQGVKVEYAKVASIVKQPEEPARQSQAPKEEAKPEERQIEQPQTKGPKKENKPHTSEMPQVAHKGKPKAPPLPPNRPYSMDQLDQWYSPAERGLEDMADEMRQNIFKRRSPRNRRDGARLEEKAVPRQQMVRVSAPIFYENQQPRIIPISTTTLGDPPEHQLDCTVYETKSVGFSVGLKVGSLVFNAGPEVGFISRSGVAWNKVVQGTIARYVELCNRYNAGMVTPWEYDARLEEIEGLYKEAKELEAKLFEQTRQRSRSGFDELDREVDKTKVKPSPEERKLEQEVVSLANRIERLEPIGHTSDPSKPCPPPDKLGDYLNRKDCDGPKK